MSINKKSLYAYCLGDFTKIEGYDRAMSDNSDRWIIHHRLELNDDGTIRYTARQLEALDLYYHRPPEELLILTNKEHGILHSHDYPDEARKIIRQKATGRTVSDEAKAKISKANKGRKFTDEQKEKLKRASAHIDRKAPWTPERRAILAEKKRIWWQNKKNSETV